MQAGLAHRKINPTKLKKGRPPLATVYSLDRVEQSRLSLKHTTIANSFFLPR
jgi:hypothetical protein